MVLFANFHSIQFIRNSGLQCCSPASGKPHRADGWRARGGTGFGAVRGGVSLVNALAARFTVAARRRRRALPCGHAGRVSLAEAVASKLPNREDWFGRDRSQSCIISRKFMRHTEVISVNLCRTVMKIGTNKHISLRAETNVNKILHTKRRFTDYISIWCELFYTVAQKELLYA